MPAASLVFTVCQALVNTHRYQPSQAAPAVVNFAPTGSATPL
jgi:hypothetical protein